MHTPDRLTVRLLLATAILLVFGVAHSSIVLAKAQSSPERELATAKQFYADGNFSRALTLLHRATARVEQGGAPNRDALLLEAYFFLGLTQHALNDVASALESFRMLLQICPACEIDASGNTPEIVALYERAGGTSRGASTPTATPPQPRTTEARPPPTRRQPPPRRDSPPPTREYPKGDLAFGYALLSLTDLDETLPVGFNVGAAYNVNRSFGVAVDLGANVKTVNSARLTFTTFSVGPRFNFRGASATGFAHLLIGGASARVDAGGFGLTVGSGYLIQPGGGVQFTVGGGDVRVQLDYLRLEDSDGGFRFAADYVIGFGEGN